MNRELRTAALLCLSEPDPVTKSASTINLAQSWKEGSLSLDTAARLAPTEKIPGHPEKPALVLPKDVKRRTMHSHEGRAATIHALVHIEFNAINLALDAIWRFADLPEAYYADWVQVAAEEALHFTLLSEHLNTLGYSYGDFPSHNSLWEMAEKTQGDILARLALIPCTMEARGLDASPALRNKFAQAGDMPAVAILDIILRDEIGHVAIGKHWFNLLCEQQDIAPVPTYMRLTEQHQAPVIRAPINVEARRQAGFTEAELIAICGEHELTQ